MSDIIVIVLSSCVIVKTTPGVVSVIAYNKK